MFNNSRSINFYGIMKNHYYKKLYISCLSAMDIRTLSQQVT